MFRGIFKNLGSKWALILNYRDETNFYPKIQRLVMNRPFSSLVIELSLVYESYLEGNMTKRAFNLKSNRAIELWNWYILMYVGLRAHK